MANPGFRLVFVIGRYTAPTPLRSLDILVCTGVIRMLSIYKIVSEYRWNIIVRTGPWLNTRSECLV